GVDKIRMKIYNKNTGAIIYDNQQGASDADLPVTPVGANSSVVIQGNNVSTTVVKTNQQNITEEKATDDLEVRAFPNPTDKQFTILVNSNNSKETIMMQIFDEVGRLREQHDGLVPGSVVRVGEKYRPGIYYVRVNQGSDQKE